MYQRSEERPEAHLHDVAHVVLVELLGAGVVEEQRVSLHLIVLGRLVVHLQMHLSCSNAI